MYARLLSEIVQKCRKEDGKSSEGVESEYEDEVVDGFFFGKLVFSLCSFYCFFSFVLHEICELFVVGFD